MSLVHVRDDASAAGDLQLWIRLQTGDPSAFETLFRAYADSLCDFARALVADDDAARDVVHALFCWIWEHRHALETPRVVRAYLFAAVRNRARNHIRDTRVASAFRERVARSDEALVRTEPLPDARAMATDLEDALARELAELPPRCREVFALLRYEGMSQAEAAATLGISRKTVEIHLGRAMKLLRAGLAAWLDPERR